MVQASFENLYMKDEYSFKYTNKIELDPCKVTKMKIAAVQIELKKRNYDLFIKIIWENFAFSDDKDHLFGFNEVNNAFRLKKTDQPDA